MTTLEYQNGQIETKVVFTDSLYPNPISWAIKKAERADMCHVAYFDGHYWEATATGIKKKAAEEFYRLNKVVKEVPISVTMDQYLKMHKVAVEYVGVEYGYFTIFGALYSRIWKRPNPFADKYCTFICSEYVYHIVKHAVDLPGFRPEIDGPAKLYELLTR